MQNFSARYCGTSVTPKPDFNAFSAFSTCVSQSHALRQAKVKWCQYITSPRHCCRPGTMCRAKTWATFYCQQLLLPTGEWTIMQYWNKSIYSCSLNLTHCQPISIYADCACDNVRRCWCGTLWSVSLQSMWNCSEQFQKGKKKKRCMDWLAVSAWHLALSCLGQPQPVCFGLPVHTFSCVFRYEPRTCWCLSLIHNFLQVVLD